MNIVTTKPPIWEKAHELFDIDDSDMLPHQPHFKTSLFKGGLTHEICHQVEQHLSV